MTKHTELLVYRMNIGVWMNTMCGLLLRQSIQCRCWNSPNAVNIWLLLARSGAHFMNDFSIIIQSRWTFHSGRIELISKWSLYHFAHFHRIWFAIAKSFVKRASDHQHSWYQPCGIMRSLQHRIRFVSLVADKDVFTERVFSVNCALLPGAPFANMD